MSNLGVLFCFFSKNATLQRYKNIRHHEVYSGNSHRKVSCVCCSHVHVSESRPHQRSQNHQPPKTLCYYTTNDGKQILTAS